MKTLPLDIHQVEALFQYNYKPLCLYALHYLEDIDRAEDIVQDSFMALWTKLEEGAEIQHHRAYLYTAVRNKCLDQIKADARYAGWDERLEQLEAEEDEIRDDSAQEARLWSAIDALPAKRRQILLMHKRDGMKYAEIAEKLGLSVNTVRNQISRALQTLKEGVIKLYFWLFC